MGLYGNYLINYVENKLDINDCTLASIVGVSSQTVLRWRTVDLNKSKPYKMKRLNRLFQVIKILEENELTIHLDALNETYKEGSLFDYVMNADVDYDKIIKKIGKYENKRINLN